MRNDNLNSFLIANKDKIIVHKGKNGKIELESLVPSEELYYYNTNCKVDRVRNKFVLTTKDGERFEITFRPKEEKVTVDNNPPSEEIKIVDEAKERKPKFRPLAQSKKGILYLQGIKDLILVKKLIKKQKKEEKSLSSQMVSPHGEFDSLKAKSSQLMPKIEEILKNEKYISDPELTVLRQRFKLIKERYDYAISKNDNAEMLNVKTKLVNLSGRIIARVNELDRQQALGAPIVEPPKPMEEPPKPVEEPPKPVEEPPKPVEEPPKPVEEPPKPVEEPPKPVEEPPKPVEEPPKQRTVKKKNTKAKKVPKTTVSAVKDTPKPSKDPLKASITRFKNTYTAKLESFDRQIGLLNEKSNLYSGEITRLEDNIMNIDQIAKDNNFDSRESKIFIEDQKEKIIEVKSKLDKVEEEKKKIEEQKQTYQNERIDVKVKNEYSDTGYIPMNMTRLEYYNRLRSTEILDERIKLREEIKKEDEEIKNLEELLAKKKEDKAKKENLDKQLFEVGTKFTQAVYSSIPVEETKEVAVDLGALKNTAASKERTRKPLSPTALEEDKRNFKELEERGKKTAQRIEDLKGDYWDLETRLLSSELADEEHKKGMRR